MINPRFPTFVLGPHFSVYFFCKYVCIRAACKGTHHLWFENGASWNCLARECGVCGWISWERGYGLWQYQERLPSEQHNPNYADHNWIPSSSFQLGQNSLLLKGSSRLVQIARLRPLRMRNIWEANLYVWRLSSGCSTNSRSTRKRIVWRLRGVRIFHYLHYALFILLLRHCSFRRLFGEGGWWTVYCLRSFRLRDGSCNLACWASPHKISYEVQWNFGPSQSCRQGWNNACGICSFLLWNQPEAAHFRRYSR